jgi:AcrR family transcriptional regulator
VPAIALIAAMLLRLRAGRITANLAPWEPDGPSSSVQGEHYRTDDGRKPPRSLTALGKSGTGAQKPPDESRFPASSQRLTTPQDLRYSTPMAKWSDEAKTHALDLLANGTTLADVARETGIPKRTIANWAANEGIDTSTAQARAKTARAREVLDAVTAEKRADLAAGLMADAQRLRLQLFAPCVEKRAMVVGGKEFSSVEIAEIERDQPTFAEQTKIMTSIAIAVDKIQLLTGEATERHEHTAPTRSPEQEQELAKVLTLVRSAA